MKHDRWQSLTKQNDKRHFGSIGLLPVCAQSYASDASPVSFKCEHLKLKTITRTV